MKTAEEKAKELVKLFSFECRECDYLENAKQCSLICIEEKIELIKSLPISDLMKQDLVENELKVKQKINEL